MKLIVAGYDGLIMSVSVLNREPMGMKLFLVPRKAA